MFKDSKTYNIELIYFIVNFGQSNKIIHEAKQCGITGSTVMLGSGTVNSRISDYLGISDIRKEIILMLAESNTAYQALEHIHQHFKLDKPNHGIAYTIPISGTVGTSCIKQENDNMERGMDEIMYHSINVVVEKGKAEEVIEAAVAAGSKGGTIINGRGAGVHETSKLFHMEIEPEKEVVLILSEADQTEAIIESIANKLKIEEPGNGIIFIQDVRKAYGIYK